MCCRLFNGERCCVANCAIASICCSEECTISMTGALVLQSVQPAGLLCCRVPTKLCCAAECSIEQAYSSMQGCIMLNQVLPAAGQWQTLLCCRRSICNHCCAAQCCAASFICSVADCSTARVVVILLVCVRDRKYCCALQIVRNYSPYGTATNCAV